MAAATQARYLVSRDKNADFREHLTCLFRTHFSTANRRFFSDFTAFEVRDVNANQASPPRFPPPPRLRAPEGSPPSFRPRLSRNPFISNLSRPTPDIRVDRRRRGRSARASLSGGFAHSGSLPWLAQNGAKWPHFRGSSSPISKPRNDLGPNPETGRYSRRRRRRG